MYYNKAPISRGHGYGATNPLNCGFSESWSDIHCKSHCNSALVNKVAEEYPIACEPPTRITIDRVVSLAGIDDALFLVGDSSNYRMNGFYNLVISDDLIGLQSFNFPAYLLLKAGDLHTLAVSTGDIQNHPISAFLRNNRHIFHGGAAELFELAAQDFEVEENDDGKHCDPHRRFPVIRVIKPTSLNIRYITIEVSWYEKCGQFITREIFYIIPLVCQNGNTCKGFNLANWDDNIRTCGETIRIPAKSTDNGSLKIADKPRKCRDNFVKYPVSFGGFRGW